ncbi:MAG: S9 family peptidase [Hyphomicrobiales bacterium]
MIAPKAKKINKELTIHNHTRNDEYYWLRERENPDVIQYLEEENKYTDHILKDRKDLQENLFKEIVGRIKQNDMSVPYLLKGYYYYNKFEEGKEYPIICRKKDEKDAKEIILLDCNELAKDFEYFQLGMMEISPDNNLLAFSADTVSRRKYDIFIKDLTTNEIQERKVTNTSGEVAWANDNKTIFFVRKDEQTLRPYQVMRCKIMEDNSKEYTVYEDADEAYYVSVAKSKSEKYIIINSECTTNSECLILNANHPEDNFQVFQERLGNVEYSVGHYKDKFYIHTNYKAKNFCLMEAPIDKTSIDNWKVLIPHRDDVLLESFMIFKEFLVLDERIKGIHQLRVIKWDKTEDYYISMPEESYMTYFHVNPDFESHKLCYGYTSLTTPNSVFSFDMYTKETKLLKQHEVLGKFNKDDYQSERIWATAKDGVQIPISIVYKKGTKKDGNNPCLLYAYGSYGNSMDPFFSSARLSLLDRGFVYAIAHIRGGEEMGRYWYEDGKMLKKRNTFTDFIACSEFLIEEKFTSNKHLYAAGGSAGGLLMGAITNMRPDLYNGIVASVPFVDVVTTMLDETIPLTTGEYDEWGNPNNKEYYDYMLSYSPYDNVEKKNYPSMLVTTGLHDSQVQYWEPAKWIARLRDLKIDDNILLLHCDMSVGHGGASGRFKMFIDVAREYNFLLMLEGINK